MDQSPTSAANLNAGTSGATWVANTVEETQVRSGSGNRVFNPDNGAYDWDLTFASTTTLDGLVFSYDAYQQRLGNGANQKKNIITGYDSDGDEIFQVLLADDNTGGNSNSGRFAYVNAGGTQINLQDGLSSQGDSGFFNDRLQSFRLEFNATGFEIFVEGASVIGNAEYRNAVGTGVGEISNLAMISFTSEPTSSSAGAFYDNFMLETIPEPSAVMLVALGGLLLLRRRRLTQG